MCLADGPDLNFRDQQSHAAHESSGKRYKLHFFGCLPFNQAKFFFKPAHAAHEAIISMHISYSTHPRRHARSHNPVFLFAENCGFSCKWGPWHDSLLVGAPSSVIWRTETQQSLFIFLLVPNSTIVICFCHLRLLLIVLYWAEMEGTWTTYLS